MSWQDESPQGTLLSDRESVDRRRFLKTAALGAAALDSVEEVGTWQAVAVRPRRGLRVGGRR